MARVSAEALAAALVKLTPRPPQAWQCSGCKRVYFGRLRHTCPGCRLFGYWTASVDREALKAEDAARERTPEEQAYDTVSEALADLADAEARAERAEALLDAVTCDCGVRAIVVEGHRYDDTATRRGKDGE